jgi:hypothetical protein
VVGEAAAMLPAPFVKGSLCLCDDFNPRWSEQTARANHDAFGVDEETTYHLLTAQSGLEAIADRLRFTDTVWHGAAAVCLKRLHLPLDRNVDPDALADCALSVVELTCTACDREGFVAWGRNVHLGSRTTGRRRSGSRRRALAGLQRHERTSSSVAQGGNET